MSVVKNKESGTKRCFRRKLCRHSIRLPESPTSFHSRHLRDWLGTSDSLHCGIQESEVFRVTIHGVPRNEVIFSGFGPATAGHRPDPFFERNELICRQLLEISWSPLGQ